jgi:aminoglycoside/choline kinase family phosphotransferase
MDAPPDKENCKPFVQVAQLMKQAGLLVPEILDWHESYGFMLISDLGRQTVLEHLSIHHDLNQPECTPSAEPFAKAVDSLVLWQTASKPNVLPNYDQAVLNRELLLFPDWYLTQHLGVSLNDSQRNSLTSVFDSIIQSNLSAPSVFVHRDFMTRNLMIPHDLNEGRLGVLDFQDALYGPITYDIASLMRDAFCSWSEEFVLDVTIRYWEKIRKSGMIDHNGWSEDFGEFWRAVEWMGLQRHLKVAGIFARLTLRDGKPKYLADTPRFLNYIKQTCRRYRELFPLLRLLDSFEASNTEQVFSFGRL